MFARTPAALHGASTAFNLHDTPPLRQDERLAMRPRPARDVTPIAIVRCRGCRAVGLGSRSAERRDDLPLAQQVLVYL